MNFLKKLLQLKRKKIGFFTTPSHAQNPPFKSILGKDYYKWDLSEVDGLDNLNAPEGCILELENEFKEIYGSGFSHMLTNGSTQGILALMLAVLKKEDKVLCAVNCHKSVHNGLILTGATPVWVYPNFNHEFGVYTSISASTIEKAIEAEPDAKCLIITNPTYDGAISDTEKISALCKKHNIIFIVDEAHGALWNFDRTIGIPAIHLGADASVQSLHKTGGAVNPAAILHLSENSRISQKRVMEALNVISTTSPSFALMANIEETVKFLYSKKGKKHLQKLIELISEAIHKIKEFEHIKLFTENNDITKILIKTCRVPAEEAAEIIYSKFKLECEIQHANALTFLCGAGTDNKKIKKLIKALKYIEKISKKREPLTFDEINPPQKIMNMTPGDAFNSEYEEVLPPEAAGKTCAQIITAYPPGIPVLTYGERICEEHLAFLDDEIKIRIVK